VKEAAGALLRAPLESIERARERVAQRRERSGAPQRYEAEREWEDSLHELLGCGWPCDARREFEATWRDVVSSLTASGLAVGRGSYGGWDDAGPGLARAAWCLTLHMRPKKVLETGVARGITTRFILEGLERHREGHLWSIDLPPLRQSDLSEESGAAVPERCRGRWTYISGSSRRRLPGLLAELGEIDLFLHDSMHTARNLRFELDHAWASLRPGGALLVDDVDHNAAFHSFTETVPGLRSLIAWHDDGQGLFGIILKDAASGPHP
jgi:predicted O-methyltransferase YrrM